MKHGLNSPGKPPGLLRKLVTLLGTVALVGLVLMFSVAVLAVILIVGTLAWAYLRWKTRELRRQMRDFSSRAMEREQMAGEGEVYEGEVVRVVDSRNER